MKQLVVSCGNDRELLQTRVMVLAFAGFQVEEVLGMERLLERQIGGDIGLVVLCHTLSEKEQQEGTKHLKQVLPGTPILILSGFKERSVIEGTSQIDPFKGPRALIALSRKLLMGEAS